MSASYKLVYFNLRGRAEPARYLFALSRTPYEDVRVESAQWPELKPTTPYGQLPVLYVDDVAYCQSEAIMRYLARKFGLYGATEEEGLAIDQVISTISDLVTETLRLRFMKPEQAEEKEKGRQKLIAEDVPKLIKFLEKQLQGGEWLVGGKLSLADVVAFEILTSQIADGFLGEWRSHSDAVAALVKRFADVPEISAYVASRAPTPL